jgi:uncharacterized membrane protein (DUF373 family)
MKLVERVEWLIVWAMLLLLLFSVLLSTASLGWSLVQTILAPPFLLLAPETLFHSFSLFLISLIGLELIKLLKAHLAHGGFDIQVVIEVAIIALCNKVVTLDVKGLPAEALLGLAALLLALSAVYFVFIKKQAAAK